MTGSIKDYTPNFEFIIPEFNITGWHDYLEENFRSIDALFYNLFGINNFKGQWKNSTVYNVDDVVFISEDINYSGRLVKVLVQHTTAGTGNFTEFFTANPSYYELFADASTAQLYAQQAKNWAVKLDGPVEDDLYSSKFYANMVNDLSTEITTLYNIRSDIQNVSMIGTEVVIVSNIKNSVQTVANNSTNINTVANNTSNINTVASNSTNINSVAGNTTNINNVAENAANISIVSANRTSINTVATNIANVSTNATNINAINTNARNISAIKSAYNNAQSAISAKNKAQEWAVSENLVDNTDYSAKHYANLAKSEAESIDDDNIVHKTGDETITGTKTFSNNPLVPNVSSDDSSNKVANTAFVTSVVSNLQTQINTKAGVDLSNINTNGKIFASSLGMPSSRYTNLTLGASGASYSAPANGFVYLSKFGNQSQFAEISCGISILNTAPFNSSMVEIWLPVKKGNSFTVNYDLAGSTDKFRFYYAEGSR